MKQVIQNIVNIILAVLCLIFAVLWIRAERADRNGQNNPDIHIPDTVYICDTANITAPIPISERFLGYETAMVRTAKERADNDGINEKPGKRTELKDSAHEINYASKIELEEKVFPKKPIDTNENASIDSCRVMLPIHERVYEDSLYKAVVRGYNPELVSLDIYQKSIYYPVVVEKEYDPPNIVVSIGPYMGFGNKGFNYGIALTVGVPLELKWPW